MTTETVTIKLKDLERLTRFARRAVVLGFSMLVIMIFHILVDFFYHT